MKYKKNLLDLGISALIYFLIYYLLSSALEWFVAGFIGFIAMLVFRKPVMDYLEKKGLQKNQEVKP